MSEKKHFFISYTQADRSWAEWIGWQLEEEKFSVILQAWDFAPGINFLESMDKALKTAERTLLVLTPAAVASKYVKMEWTAALNESQLVPVRVVDFDPDGLLSTHAYIDLVDLAEEEAKELQFIARVCTLEFRIHNIVKIEKIKKTIKDRP